MATYYYADTGTSSGSNGFTTSETAGTTCNCTITWGIWNTDTVISDNEINGAPIYVPQGIDRQEQKRYEKLKKEKADAEQKAKELLLDLIGEKELEIYNKTGRLFVHGKQYDYIVPKEGLIQRIEKDKVTDLCIHLRDRHGFPETDNVISLKLLAEADEKQFNSIANQHHPRSRPEELPECACMGARG